MNNKLFDINNFNIIQDAENYYFFRALNLADNADIEERKNISEEGRIQRIRTDRERFDGNSKYKEDSENSLEEMYDHIKMYYRKDTNCISLTTNANIAINYGRGSYKDKYIIVRIPKNEFEGKVVVAGQYMLQELYSRINEAVENLSEEEKKQKILSVFEKIENATDSNVLKEIITKRYTAKNGELDPNKAHLRRGTIYSAPKAKISSYQSLNQEQLLETNKVYDKLAILENENILNNVIANSSNSKLRETIGNAFSSAEVIHYKDIKQENIIEVPKELVDIFALIQQVDGIDKNKIEKLKQAVIIAFQNGKQISETSEIEEQVKDNISIEEMYEITQGRVEYGKADSIVKNMFYLSKSRKNAIVLSNILQEILEENSDFRDVIQYIRENGFRIEPEIITRKSGKGVKLSESVNLDLQKEERQLVDEIKNLSLEELEIVLQNGGLNDTRDIITKTFNNIKEDEVIDKSRYYAEAIISKYNWQEIGIEEFKIFEKNELIKRLQEKNCIEIYEKLKEYGIKENKIPTLILNITMRSGFYEKYKQGKLQELLDTRQDILQNNINIEIVERFLGYYDVENTEIRLKDYQQRACNNIDKIFEDKKFAQVILPTGAGKTFVALAQMQKYALKHPNEKMLYLAPQEEILNQVKTYIVKYIHGNKGTVGKSVDEIVAEVFQNIKFETYSGLLAKRGKEVLKDEYGMIVLDELHRTGAKEWEGQIDKLLENQNENVKVLGITATPIRDIDGRDMANETAKKLGYTDEEIKQRKHIASNMTLENAIRMGYVVNPKLVYCKYDLISSGKMDELKLMIDDIEDETIKAQELQRYNELREKLNKEIDEEIGEEARKKLEEEARKNLDSGIGKEEILKQNVKKGGKYIVFIPITDQGDIEDEEGNRIGLKTGENKIKAYQDYLNEIFKGTEIVPQCHAMTGTWNSKGKNKLGQDKNQQELNAFETDNTDKTKFMVVMNKANEGLHIDGVDGIIWFRALDENSRILYLQQLGRAIFAIDEDNPLPDDKRPIIIDLANNSLTVKMEKEFENIQPIDDLESLSILTEWINQHDGNLPNGNSTSKQEQHYYSVLRRIQKKYSKYLDGLDDIEKLTDEDKSRIEEIIGVARDIDLWSIELPVISKKYENEKEMNPFEVTGVLRDFIKFKDEYKTNQIEDARNISLFIKICETLHKNGFDIGGFYTTKRILVDGIKKRRNKTLLDVAKENVNIDIDRILRETGVSLYYPIGSARNFVLDTINGKTDAIITKAEKEKLIHFGIIKLEEQSRVTTLKKVFEELNKQGFDSEKFVYSKTIIKNGERKSVSKTLEDIGLEYPNIDINKVLILAKVALDYPIGKERTIARLAALGKGDYRITEEEREELIQLGIIQLKRETSMEKFLKVCESLAKQKFNFREFNFTEKIEKNGNKRKRYKNLRDLAQEFPNINIEEVLKESGVTLEYSIGGAKQQAVQHIKDNKTNLLPKEMKERLIQLGVIELERESIMSIFVRVCKSLSKQNFKFSKFNNKKTVEKDGEKIRGYNTLEDISLEYPNIDMKKVLEETGVDLDYQIGRFREQAKAAISGRKKILITQEEKEQLIQLNVIKLERETAMAIFVKVCEELFEQGFNFKQLKSWNRFKENDKSIERPTTLRDIAEEYSNLDIEKVLENVDVDLDYSIGLLKTEAEQIIKGNRKAPLTEKEIQRLIELGVINISVLENAKIERDLAKEKNDKAKELEEELTVELKKRGNIREK